MLECPGTCLQPAQPHTPTGGKPGAVRHGRSAAQVRPGAPDVQRPRRVDWQHPRGHLCLQGSCQKDRGTPTGRKRHRAGPWRGPSLHATPGLSAPPQRESAQPLKRAQSRALLQRRHTHAQQAPGGAGNRQAQVSVFFLNPYPRTFFHCFYRARRGDRHQLAASLTHPDWGSSLQPFGFQPPEPPGQAHGSSLEG